MITVSLCMKNDSSTLGCDLLEAARTYFSSLVSTENLNKVENTLLNVRSKDAETE